MKKTLLSLLILILLFAFLAGCEDPVELPSPEYPNDAWFTLAITDNTYGSHDYANAIELDFNGTVRPDVVAPKRVTEPPVIDGHANEAAWELIEPTQLILTKAAGGTDIVAATVKSVYTETHLYFLVSWLDPTYTQNDTPCRWVYSGGQWYNKYDENGQPSHGGEMRYEDALMLGFTDETRFPDFSTLGCASTCHGDAYHYTPPESFLDVWYWGAGRTNPRFQADDWYRFGGTAADPGGAPFLFNSTGNNPAYQHIGDPNSNTPYLWAEESIIFDTGASWVSGSTVAGNVLYEANGGRGNVEARGRFNGGAWTVELGRLLDTGDPYDYIFTWEEEEPEE
ncbi:hypothetical protein K8R78_01680 [bacterium]|nr:hypothetical protein [bacterium]